MPMRAAAGCTTVQRRACFVTDKSNDPVAAGLAKIRAPTAEGARVTAALRDALAVKTLEFNAHGVELNQRYESAAVIADTTTQVFLGHSAEIRAGLTLLRRYYRAPRGPEGKPGKQRRRS